jgi:hypothetical protein
MISGGPSSQQRFGPDLPPTHPHPRDRGHLSDNLGLVSEVIHSIKQPAR